MDNIEKLYEVIKKKDDVEIKDVIKDIIIIDGAIVEESSYEYKNDVYEKILKEYQKELHELTYHKIKSIVDFKVDEFIDSDIKSINTKLGNLKNMLIRIAGIKLYTDKKIECLLKELNNSEEVEKIFLEIDSILVEHIK